MRIFRKANVPTRVHNNGHNLACDQYFSRNLHHWIQHIIQNLNFYEISRVVPFLRAGHILWQFSGGGGGSHGPPLHKILHLLVSIVRVGFSMDNLTKCPGAREEPLQLQWLSTLFDARLWN